MAMDINVVTIIGNLTSDAEFKMTPSGKELLKFSIANNRDFKDKKKANFISVTLWGKLAAAIQDYMKKGTRVCVVGEINHERWEQDGQKRERHTITANSIQMLSSRRDGAAPAASDGPPDEEPPAGAGSGPHSDDIPF